MPANSNQTAARHGRGQGSQILGQNLGQQKGFTLVEMLIAVVIFAIVTAIAIPAYDNYSRRGYRTEVMSDLLMCAQAIERFNAMNFTYVGVTTDGAADGALDPDVCNMGSVNQNRCGDRCYHGYHLHLDSSACWGDGR